MTELEKIQKRADRWVNEVSDNLWVFLPPMHTLSYISVIIHEAYEAGKKDGIDIMHPDGIERE